MNNLEKQINIKIKKAQSLTKETIFPFSLFYSKDYITAAELYNEIGNMYISIDDKRKGYKYYMMSGECYLHEEENGLAMHSYIRAGESIKEVSLEMMCECYVKGCDVGVVSGCYSICGSKYCEAGKVYLELYENNINKRRGGVRDVSGRDSDVGADVRDGSNVSGNSISTSGISNGNITNPDPNPCPNPNFEGDNFLEKSLMCYKKGINAYLKANMKMCVMSVYNSMVIVLLHMKRYEEAGDTFLRMRSKERKYNNSYYLLCGLFCYKMISRRIEMKEIEEEVLDVKNDYSGYSLNEMEEEERNVYDNLGNEKYEEIVEKYCKLRNIEKEIVFLFKEIGNQSKPEHDIL